MRTLFNRASRRSGFGLVAMLLAFAVLAAACGGPAPVQPDLADDADESATPTPTSADQGRPTPTPVDVPSTPTPEPTGDVDPTSTPTPPPIPTANPTAPVVPSTPTPVPPTPSPVPSTPTPVPPTPTPTPTARPVSIDCEIAPNRPVLVGEHLTFTAKQTPAHLAVSYTFDHGDGTLDPGPVSKAYYEAPGHYGVKLRWSHGGGSGTISCGTVTVKAVGSPPGVWIDCRIEPRRTVLVGERLTFTALQNPVSAPIQFTFDHGDRTLDPGSVSKAFYEAPGSYHVKLRWTYAGKSGAISCGTVTVAAAPTPTPGTVSVSCRIEPSRTVAVNEILTFTALQQPANVPVEFAFDHGDGTIDPGSVSKAFYRDPGSYDVTLQWSHAGGEGVTYCGTVTVVAGPPVFDADDYLGKSLAAAKQTAEQKGFVLRVLRIDGEYFPGTDDYRTDRVNVEIDNALVTRAAIG